MRAVVVHNPGKEAALTIGDIAPPRPASNEVLISVSHTAVNRADLLQSRGLYPPPEGASNTLGLECAGVIAEVGPGVTRWQPGQRVMALLTGGGYAESAVAHQDCLLQVPDHLSDSEAAAFPETFLTAFLNIFELGRARSDERVLIHGGGSGVGTAALSLCADSGITTVVTAGSDEKCQRCLEHGAHHAINYRSTDFAGAVKDFTDGEGVDVILDCIGARYLDGNLKALRSDGRLVVIGLMGGARAELNLGKLLSRRLQIIGSTLRALAPTRKREIISAFTARFGESLQAGKLRPAIHTIMPIEEVAAAHQLLEESSHFGKVVLQVGT